MEWLTFSFYLIQREKRLLLQGLQVDLKQAAQILTEKSEQNHQRRAIYPHVVLNEQKITQGCLTRFIPHHTHFSQGRSGGGVAKTFVTGSCVAHADAAC